MTAEFQYDLFVSYADADRAWVDGFLLPAVGVPHDRVITQREFKPGAPLIDEYERAVSQSRYSVLVLSSAYLRDEWANLGENFASFLSTGEHSARVIPLLKEPCELPLRIDFRVKLDCTDPELASVEIARLREFVERSEPVPERIPCPYPGMRHFDASEARFFFGREHEIDELVRRLRVQDYLFVIGPSGSGKSSLVFAGLVSELQKRQPDQWYIASIRPGADPHLELTRALTELDAQTKQQANRQTTRLLIIDQFEELFTLNEKPAQTAFIDAVKKLRAERTCKLIVVLRADFYPDFMTSDLWPLSASERVEIAPLNGAALREAIVKPAERVGVYLEPQLVERLMNDAANEPGVLPLLQETMVLLWDKMDQRLLSLHSYEKLGQGNLSGLAVALSTRADAVLGTPDFGQIDPAPHTLTRRIFLRLIQFGEGRADTRRQQTLAQLRSQNDDTSRFDRTLQHLTLNRLLTLSGEEKSDTDRKVDISHEVLITGWATLQTWIHEHREAEQTRRRLEEKANEWVRLGNSRVGLLDEVQLREADNWLHTPEATEIGYDDNLLALVHASSAMQREEEASMRRIQRFRMFALVGIGVLIIAVFALIAFSQSQLAIEQQKAAATAQAFGQAQATARAQLASQQELTQNEANARATAQAEAENQQKAARAEANARATARAETAYRTEESISRSLSVLGLNAQDIEMSLLLTIEAAKHAWTGEAQDLMRKDLVAYPVVTNIIRPKTRCCIAKDSSKNNLSSL